MDSGSWHPNADDLAPAVSMSDKVLHLELTISCVYSRGRDWEMCECSYPFTVWTGSVTVT